MLLVLMLHTEEILIISIHYFIIPTLTTTSIPSPLSPLLPTQSLTDVLAREQASEAKNTPHRNRVRAELLGLIMLQLNWWDKCLAEIDVCAVSRSHVIRKCITKNYGDRKVVTLLRAPTH